MTSPPAFQWYAKDWLSECITLGLSQEEKAAYADMMSVCWLEGTIPVDPARLARVLSLTPKQAAETWEAVKSRFQVAGGLARHVKLEEQRARQVAWREKSSKGGKRSAESRKGGS
jgi:uncharacterized protein YdaU (DUF1376 family)